MLLTQLPSPFPHGPPRQYPQDARLHADLDEHAGQRLQDGRAYFPQGIEGPPIQRKPVWAGYTHGPTGQNTQKVYPPAVNSNLQAGRGARAPMPQVAGGAPMPQVASGAPVTQAYRAQSYIEGGTGQPYNLNAGGLIGPRDRLIHAIDDYQLRQQLVDRFSLHESPGLTAQTTGEGGRHVYPLGYTPNLAVRDAYMGGSLQGATTPPFEGRCRCASCLSRERRSHLLL
jgi:hypothetical protein